MWLSNLPNPPLWQLSGIWTPAVNSHCGELFSLAALLCTQCRSLILLRLGSSAVSFVLFFLGPGVWFRALHPYLFSDMATPFEAANPDARRWERERQRRLVLDSPHTTAISSFHTTLASMLLTLQTGAEDALLSVLSLPETDATRVALESIKADVRGVLATSTSMFGRFLLAANYDTALVDQVMAMEEPFPGVSPAQMRAIRLQSAALIEESGRKMSCESAQSRLRRQQFTAASTAASSLPPLPALPAPVPAPRDGKALYACHACLVKGHWKGDGKCRPEDVRVHLARLSALVHPAGREEPPAPGTSGSGTELEFIYLCQCFVHVFVIHRHLSG